MMGQVQHITFLMRFSLYKTKEIINNVISFVSSPALRSRVRILLYQIWSISRSSKADKEASG